MWKKKYFAGLCLWKGLKNTWKEGKFQRFDEIFEESQEWILARRKWKENEWAFEHNSKKLCIDLLIYEDK